MNTVVIYRQPDLANDDMGEVFGPFRTEQIALNWIDLKQILHNWKGKFTITTMQIPDAFNQIPAGNNNG